MQARSVVLVDRRRVNPDDLAKIQAALEVELIPVDPSMLEAFMPLTVFIPDTEEEEQAPRGRKPKAAA